MHCCARSSDARDATKFRSLATCVWTMLAGSHNHTASLCLTLPLNSRTQLRTKISHRRSPSEATRSVRLPGAIGEGRRPSKRTAAGARPSPHPRVPWCLLPVGRRTAGDHKKEDRTERSLRGVRAHWGNPDDGATGIRMYRSTTYAHDGVYCRHSNHIPSLSNLLAYLTKARSKMPNETMTAAGLWPVG